MRKGLEVKADASVLSGFKISLVGQDVQHDLTAEAIAEAIDSLQVLLTQNVKLELLGKFELRKNAGSKKDRANVRRILEALDR